MYNLNRGANKKVPRDEELFIAKTLAVSYE